MFVDIERKYRLDPESGYNLDLVRVTVLTEDDDLYEDYELVKYVVKSPGLYAHASVMANPKVVEVNLPNDSLGDLAHVGIDAVANKISSGLSSHATLFSGWHKLAGRTVILVTLKDGALLVFFASAYGTKNYIYLEGTAVYSAGEFVEIGPGSSTPNKGTAGDFDGGSWHPVSTTDYILACTSIKGNDSSRCEWIPKSKDK
jgi:hypothetical protein